MRSKSQSNQFQFNLPQTFIDDSLEKKFQLLMDKNFVPYDGVLSYLSSTIKQVVFPSTSYDTVKQTYKHGKSIKFREAGNVMDKYQNQLDVQFKSVDSHLNYFIMLEISNAFYLKQNNYLPELTIHILDKDGDIIYTILLAEVIISSLSELQLSYNSSNFSEQTFSLQITYNYIHIMWGIGYDEDDTNKGREIFDIDLIEGDPRDVSGLEKAMIKRKLDSEKRIEE